MAVELTATLYINLYNSRCGQCRKNTLPNATHHTDISGWTPRPGRGCGARFVATDSDYPGITNEQLREMRPDLPARPATKEPTVTATSAELAAQACHMQAAANAIATNDPHRRWEASVNDEPIGRWDTGSGAMAGAAVHYENAHALKPGTAALSWDVRDHQRTYLAFRGDELTGYTVRHVPATA